MKILTVDDNAIIRKVVSNSLRSFDCEVLEAGNGAEGLVVTAEQRPDLIILDLMMPVMDGATMLAQLKERPEIKDIPVLVLTAQSGQEKLSQIARLGSRDYLPKPFSKDQLLEKIIKIVPLPSKAGPAVRGPTDSEPSGVKITVPAEPRFSLEPIKAPVHRLAKLVQSQDLYLKEPAHLFLMIENLQHGFFAPPTPTPRIRMNMKSPLWNKCSCGMGLRRPCF